MSQRRFLIEWILANVVGLLVGSLLGATDGGAIKGVAGDLLLGASVGVAQWWVLRRHLGGLPGLWWWLPATAFGYAAGVVLGRRFSPMMTTDHLVLGFVFGVFVGTFTGAAQAIAIRFIQGRSEMAINWFMITLTAWIAGEVVAFVFYFRLEGVPLVGLAVALISGLMLPSLTQPADARPTLPWNLLDRQARQRSESWD
jgi:hypothetical protein